MRWVTVATDRGPRACGLLNGKYVDVNAACPDVPFSLRELLTLGTESAAPRVVARCAGIDRLRCRDISAAGHRFPTPRKIICIGLNYRDHAAESGVPVPIEPVLFSKYPSALIGHRGSIVLPRVSREVDYEAELVVVIGQAGRHIPRECPRSTSAATRSATTSPRATGSSTSRASSGWPARRSTRSPRSGPELVTPDEVPDPTIWASGCA